ncbi:hypothetical protein Hypma_009127 [Hypsizygus marmoreus]|uniref:Uncharacterized protein n=1 Tax=Hypsizygus marmoreus TaxID=39966 RepID=A0A369JQ06_HYPMA|nr:hypothetical protein Hypma_009127 [Hypsizygus marmoreus]
MLQCWLGNAAHHISFRLILPIRSVEMSIPTLRRWLDFEPAHSPMDKPNREPTQLGHGPHAFIICYRPISTLAAFLLPSGNTGRRPKDVVERQAVALSRGNEWDLSNVTEGVGRSLLGKGFKLADDRAGAYKDK